MRIVLAIAMTMIFASAGQTDLTLARGVVQPEAGGLATFNLGQQRRISDDRTSAAPNFTLKDLSGRAVSLASLRGKVVLIDFWATWCQYCVDEFPMLEQLQREYRQQGLVILAVNVEDAETAREFIQQNGYTLATLIDVAGEVTDSYHVDAFPSTFVIDREGQLVRHFIGLASRNNMRRAIESAGIRSRTNAV